MQPDANAKAAHRHGARSAATPRTGGADHNISDEPVRACVRVCLCGWANRNPVPNERPRKAADRLFLAALRRMRMASSHRAPSEAPLRCARAPAVAPRCCSGRRRPPARAAAVPLSRARRRRPAQRVGVYAGRGEPGGRWEDLDVPCQSVTQTHPHPHRPPTPTSTVLPLHSHGARRCSQRRRQSTRTLTGCSRDAARWGGPESIQRGGGLRSAPSRRHGD
jgi:hypothetical protein